MTIYAGYIRQGIPPSDIGDMPLEDLFILNSLVFGGGEEENIDDGFY